MKTSAKFLEELKKIEEDFKKASKVRGKLFEELNGKLKSGEKIDSKKFARELKRRLKGKH